MLILLPLLSLTGCGTIQYYAQSIAGQFEVVRHARPVAEVMLDPATPAKVREALVLVQEIRKFARDEMLLPDNGSYGTYKALGRRFVVWNVFATPELSVDPVGWCFPVAGCLSYRGYFDEAMARRFAASLEQQGLDTFVGGVDAYSTLGWFRDPVLDTMLNRSPAEIVKLLLHELAHQRVYFNSDSDFNEAFADSVAAIGIERWLAARPVTEMDRYRVDQTRDQAFFDLILTGKQEAGELYRAGGNADGKRAAKQALGDDLLRRYRELSREWTTPDIYLGWFTGGMNNARLAAVSTYRELVPGLMRVYAANGGNLELFYAVADGLRNCNAAARRRWLEQSRPDEKC